MLQRRAELILAQIGHAESELSLSLVDDPAIAELNLSYRKLDRPTDVLSFSLLEGEESTFRGNLLGDVVISVETAVRQAREQDVSLDEELARLLIHGVLHLIGHDHMEAEEEQRMQAEERRLSEVLNL
ncbi:MAG: rRNA maturation RNase YbeY [Deltaproteobacteria bacterium]|nr:rRNA maturation RNase YbeY [Deltaproteobacteria bacterium]